MGAVAFNNQVAGTSGTSEWLTLTYGTDFDIHTDSNIFIDNITVHDARYWKNNQFVTVTLNIDVETNANVTSNTNIVSFTLLNSDLIAEPSKYMNYCLYSRTLRVSEKLSTNDHPMLEVTKDGVIFKKPLLEGTDQDGSLMILGDITPNIISFKTDGIGINHIYNFNGQISYSSDV